MHTASAAPRAASGSSRALTIVLLVVAAAGLLVRIAAIAEPLGIDQSLWASAVRGMARGQLLYRDVWEQRPPGIYFIYLAGFSLFGWTSAAVAWLDILAAAATTTLVWAIVRRLAGPVAGAAAAASYALFTVPAWLFSHGGFLERTISETFIIVFVSAAAWFAVRYADRTAAFDAFGVGLACGAAVVMKPNAGLYFPAFVAWMVCYGRAGGTMRVTAPLAALAGAALLPLLTLAWLWRLDLLREASIAVIDFNRFYVGQGFALSTYAVDFSKAVFLRIKTDPVWLAGSLAAAAAVWELLRTRRLPPLAGLAVIWGAAAALVIVVNGARLFNSYFTQAYAPLVVLATWMLIEWAPRLRWRRAVAAVTIVLMLVILVRRDYLGRVAEATSADLASLSGRIDRATYLERFGGYDNKRGYSARAIAELADYVRTHTTPDEQIFLFGISGAGIYFEADRLTAHRFLRVNFFVPTEFPDPRFTLQAVIADLEKSRPRYLIFERLNAVSPRGAEMARAVDALEQNPVLADLLAGYRLEQRIEDFTLYRRVD
jgi:4-amino-4-deoxy-L-arabinose transferase-like glycosyltransferase